MFILRLNCLNHLDSLGRANLESLESLSGGSGSGAHSERGGGAGGQERVVRAFAELARNLQRMRPCVRPAMCKPYGKQSEQLQKSTPHILVQQLTTFTLTELFRITIFFWGKGLHENLLYPKVLFMLYIEIV